MSQNEKLISTVRVECGAVHDKIHVWNRGGKAGVLIVNHGDGAVIAGLLGPFKYEIKN